MWYCDACHYKLYEEYLHVSDIEADLSPVFERFYANQEHLRCKQCGHVQDPGATDSSDARA